MTDSQAQSSSQDAAGTNGRFRNWSGTLNCGFTGESCKLTVHGEYRLGGRCKGARLEKRTTDFNPTLFTIDIVETEGEADDDWIKLQGTFDASKEVEHAIVRNERDDSHKFPVHQLER